MAKRRIKKVTSNIYLPIDTKSLYFNIKNDNLSGHTATVATPIKQGNSYNEELGQVYRIKEKEIDFDAKPLLIRELLKNSKSTIQIKNVFVFDKIAVNGINIKTDKQYCIFIKEEVDPQKAQFGRLKLHYPNTLKYSDLDIEIDNKEIIKLISKELKDYAFIVKGFEYDLKSCTLNFDALIVGENNIPYSKVFINEKGVGNKFTKVFNDTAEDYDMEIISIRQNYSESIDVTNYYELCNKLKLKSMDIIGKHLKKVGASKIEMVSANYPYSLYDLRYLENGQIKYACVLWTTTKINYFNLSIKKNLFLHDFQDNCQVFLIKDILKDGTIKCYNIEDLDRLNKSINSIRFTDEGE